LRGYLDIRDRVLPSISYELGELADKLGDQINAIHNRYTAVPPPALLEGRGTGLDVTDLHNFSGSTVFYAFDTNDNVVAQATIDLRLFHPVRH
ncbi:MAG: hypothetical protein HC927_01545, partial [Deltaproteobacteria bacterium]|nr:hypothetical protein [Deltaproteobacteria bacterium]